MLVGSELATVSETLCLCVLTTITSTSYFLVLLNCFRANGGITYRCLSHSASPLIFQDAIFLDGYQGTRVL